MNVVQRETINSKKVNKKSMKDLVKKEFSWGMTFTKSNTTRIFTPGYFSSLILLHKQEFAVARHWYQIN